MMQSSWRLVERLPGNGAVRTLDEVAQLMGMTRQRVQVIEQIALRKLRNGMGDELRRLYAEAMLRDQARSDATAGAVRVRCFDEENQS